MKHMSDPAPLEPRREPERSGRFHRGARKPLAIRWFGMTALAGHLRHLLAVAAASNQLDLRDWMRPEDAAGLLDRVSLALGGSASGDSLTERLGREVWIDFVADTGDDHDVSLAVGRMLFAEYALSGDKPRTLPRGDILIFGGDIAYPASTAYELERRLLRPWNQVLHDKLEVGRRRVVLGIPGNHDWYDALDGFGRFFRRGAFEDVVEPAAESAESAERGGSATRSRDSLSVRAEGNIRRILHLDEFDETLHMVEETAESVFAILRQSETRRPGRLILSGYTAVQEASYWAMALAPGLDLWGVDRQLRSTDFRQRVFFAQRREKARPRKFILVSPDPAMTYGEPNEPGVKILEACHFSPDSDNLLYLTGDTHHYERQAMANSTQVIAGGGGAFVHGSRIARNAKAAAPECVYPDRETSLRLIRSMPLRLAAGTAGFLLHGVFALLAYLEILAFRRGPVTGGLTVAAVTIIAAISLSFAVRHRLERPAATWAISILFGLILGLAPLGIRFALSITLPWLGDWVVVPGNAFLGPLTVGVFLLVLILTGLEHQQGFAALGHPGFRHFVRLCVHPEGKVEGFVIGKDDPVGEGAPVLIDRFVWK
jgi:hypothetical protein